MSEPVYGLTKSAGHLLNQMADKHRQRLPDAGRRTRRVPPMLRGTLLVGIEIVSIDSSDPDDIVATCIVTYRPCGMTVVPGEDEYAQIEVHDRVYRCLFTDAAVGDRGAAAYMLSDVDEDPYGECDWECMGLCC